MDDNGRSRQAKRANAPRLWQSSEVLKGRPSDDRRRTGQATTTSQSTKSARGQRALCLLPEFSGLAFLHVWNGIQEDVFPRRFKSIIEAAYDNFFVDCTIEPVADYRAFLDRLKTLDRITELSARVHPPNPLFGRLWGGLDKYVKKRKAEEVSVRETTDKPNGLSTQLIVLIQNILENPKYEPESEPDITDAAMLMAADGYGNGKAVGNEGEHEVIVRTSESQKSFLFSKEPRPEDLAKAAQNQFERVSDERDMNH